MFCKYKCLVLTCSIKHETGRKVLSDFSSAFGLDCTENYFHTFQNSELKYFSCKLQAKIEELHHSLSDYPFTISKYLSKMSIVNIYALIFIIIMLFFEVFNFVHYASIILIICII